MVVSDLLERQQVSVMTTL